jgi:acyl carrier protein
MNLAGGRNAKTICGSVGVDCMSDSTNICKQVLRIFSDKLHIEVASLETDLIDSGLLDSLALMNLLLHLEKAFGLVVSIEDLEVDHFRSARRISEFVMKIATPKT